MSRARRVGRIGCLASALLGLTVLAVVPASADPITISSGTAAAMVASLVGANPGITVVGGSQVYTGAAGAAGTFAGGAGVLPFSSGVALTTGSAAGIPGPNNTPSYGVSNGTAGNANLNTLLSAGQTTYDAASLQFSFIPTGNDISLQYIFGSEEYNELVGWPYNDPFAFYLNGVNIALIPNTTTPVNASTVNAGAYSQYFTTNTGGGLDIQYDGLVSLTATGSVIPNQVNTIQFVIADAGTTTPNALNRLYDSGILLSQGSFITGNDLNSSSGDPDPVVPEPGTLFLMGTGALMLLQRARARARSKRSAEV